MDGRSVGHEAGASGPLGDALGTAWGLTKAAQATRARRATKARPARRGPGRMYGHVYRRELYEQIVEELLAQASLGAGAIASVIGEVSRAASLPDRSNRDRIARERDRAMVRYLRDRDAPLLEQRMTQLDREQAAAEIREPMDAVPADVADRYVRELPETWRQAEGGSGRQLLASALFDRIDVLGLRQATVHLSEHAVRHGLAAALPEVVGISVNGRGERDSPSLTQPPAGFLLVNRTPPAKERSQTA